MCICNFETNFEVSCVFWCQLIILNSIMCHNNTMNSFTIARTPKLVFNETGKIKNMQISIHVLYMHVLYMYIMHCATKIAIRNVTCKFFLQVGHFEIFS